MKFSVRLFLVLWLFGMAGVLSFLLVDIPALVEMVPREEGVQVPELPPLLLKFLSVLQPAVLTTFAVFVGTLIAPKVGLHAPASEAFANRQAIFPALRPQIVPGIIVGLLSGGAIITSWLLAKPYLSDEFIARSQQFNALIPAAVRFLYGGFTEEVLVRWGVMSLFVWLLWKAFARKEAVPRSSFFLIAIVVSALLFGAGHLPIASMIGGGLTVPIVAYVIFANSIFGVAAGFLYRKLGLESAIIAHVCAHVVLITALSLI